ncbi:MULTISPECIES: AAA domain-containing protein [Pontibacillus]|uniref:AAA domain-containing protein n=1 Tax=Pontibacillus chungwhensis TaxID=265426 RepID=A0ABY8UZY2_9BACI|nr:MULTISPECIES: AAA domain-containing protein [Pontibacillus]MCD5324444.1 AAA domain-containing protein [Pontibacillus sp. HN14]WIF99261.1 AAA domain-containing protein [Pontibacillus chungwhensis]
MTFATNEITSKEKAINLYSYLMDFQKLTMKPVKHVSKYTYTLWLQEAVKISSSQSFLTYTDADVLQLDKPVEPILPPVPECLQGFVSFQDEPTLKPQLKKRKLIIPEQGLGDQEWERFYAYLLIDHTHVQEAFRTYLDEVWNPWREAYQSYLHHQALYSYLFKMHQFIHKNEESFEAVLGLGLLNWPLKSVSRHLLTHPVTIKIDPESGQIEVSLANGKSMQLEDDMIEVRELPDRSYMDSLKEELNEHPLSLDEFEPIEAVLKSFVQTLSSEGTYTYEEEKDGQKQHPNVSFTPGIIIRKRSNQHYIRSFQTIRSELEKKDQLPRNVERLVRIMDDQSPRSSNQTEGPSFPLPANDEQMKIVEKLEGRDGVIVQGPPGTGKSHTIANLMSHLLTEGQKVLVTSHTANALSVLKDKLPEDLQQLCVNLLGNDKKAFQDLEAVVKEITNAREYWDEDEKQREIEKIQSELKSLKSRKTKFSQDLRTLQEQEISYHDRLHDPYQGKLQEIAKIVNANQDQFDWLTDEVDSSVQSTFTVNEMLTYARTVRKIDPLQERQLQQSYPPSKELLSRETFERIVHQEQTVKQQLIQLGHPFESKDWSVIRGLKEKEALRGKEALDEYVSSLSSIKQHESSWLNRALQDIWAERELLWRQLYDQYYKNRDRVDEAVETIQVDQLSIPEDMDEQKVLRDAESLLHHFQKNGAKKGIPGFRPKPIKQGFYILKEVTLEGSPCDTVDQLQKLVEVLQTKSIVESLKSDFEDLTGETFELKNKLAFKWLELKVMLRKLSDLHNVIECYRTLRRETDTIHLKDKDWTHTDNVYAYRDLFWASVLQSRLEELQAQVREFREQAIVPNLGDHTHPLVDALDEAITNRDVARYESVLKDIRHLELLSKEQQLAHAFESKISGVLPNLIQSIKTYPYNQWEERLPEIYEAIDWKEASIWIENLLSQTPQSLEDSIKSLESKIKNLEMRLITLESWRNCIQNITTHESSHLRAWTSSIRRVGKGTGKNAEYYKRKAQHHMEECRSAVPAWIMPMYQVAESITPEEGMFDVVIIDEASQSGPEALMFMYLAKKVIVVGDDKQISPHFVGINEDDVHALQKQYLQGVPHGDSFGVKSSFFDIANILFEGRVVLREHFRSMPEIIEFSNLISYPDTPLIPLKSYSSNRLKPVQSFYLPDGVREGKSPKVRNVQEADEIVRQIKECLNDPKYDGKTFGVISLLGHNQANMIEKKLIEEIDQKELLKRKIICGDAHKFQGDERDVIFLSMVAAPGEIRVSPLTDNKYKRSFNVAMSRAKEQVNLVHSITTEDIMNKECIRYQMLQYFKQPYEEKYKADKSLCDSQFEKDVYDHIRRKGYNVIPQYKVGGYRIDLVVEGANGRMAVECDGDYWHGIDQLENDQKRQSQLERVGWNFWRVRGSEFYLNPEKAMESLWETLDYFGIQPGEKGA